MVAWHRSRQADLGLRALGLMSWTMAYFAVRTLVAMRISPQSAGALAYGLATIGFLGASAGSALAFMGNHLFDEIEVSSRWRGNAIDELQRDGQ